MIEMGVEKCKNSELDLTSTKEAKPKEPIS